MKAKNNFKGVITALVTPFKGGDLDLKSFVRLLRAQMDQGIRAFVINGTTGESPTLRKDEVQALFNAAKTELGGAAQLIVGTGGNSTAATCEFSEEVSRWKPDALLVVTPYYNKPPQRGLFQHFKSVAVAAKVPVLLYNVPSRTAVNLSAETVVQLSGEEFIAGIKDATGDIGALTEERERAHDGFSFLSGDDGSCVDYCASGGDGVISVSSHIIGAEMSNFIERASAGQSSAADEYRAKYADLMKWLYIESNPIPVKMALHWMGLLDSPELRLPLVSLDQKFYGDFRACLNKIGKC